MWPIRASTPADAQASRTTLPVDIVRRLCCVQPVSSFD
jgi:hypothetical protein